MSMHRTIDIACLQTRPMPDIALALDEALPLAETAVAAGAEAIFLPEYCGGLKSNGAALDPPAEREADHDFLARFQDFARDRGVWVLLGSIAVKSANKIVNRGYLLDPNGQVFDRYDKIHMFDVQLSDTEVYRESDTISGGETCVLYDTEIGRIGHTICYDLRFPQLYRTLAQAGADIICAPAAFTKRTGEAHWHILNRARAIENGCFIVSPCAIGPIPGGGESYGHSLVVNPWGEVVADGGDLPGIVQARIDLAKVDEAHSRIPSLTHDRAFDFNPTRRTA